MTASVISMINLKGGVGKTTLTVGLAWELAKNYDVLVVDIDPQFNATQWIVPTSVYLDWLKDGNKTVFDIFLPAGDDPARLSGSRAQKKVAPTTLTNTVIQVKEGNVKLNIVPSILDLMQLDAARRGTENRLRNFLKPALKKYDYILIDCPPTASLFSYAAYLASDAYLVPVKPDPLSVLGLPLLEKAMQDYENLSGEPLRRLGLVFTQVRQVDAMRRTMAQVRSEYTNEVFEASLPLTTGVAEAVELGESLQAFHKTKVLLKQTLADLADEFIERVVDL
jgi:chromosome partitioning protein